MGTVVIILAIAALCAYGVYSYFRKLRRGGSCCGEHEAADKKIKVLDRDKSNYPYHVKLIIDGMTCGNCVRRVENALNSQEGTWAKVDLGSRQATVLLKKLPDVNLLKKVVRDAGYTVLNYKDLSQ